MQYLLKAQYTNHVSSSFPDFIAVYRSTSIHVCFTSNQSALLFSQITHWPIFIDVRAKGVG